MIFIAARLDQRQGRPQCVSVRAGGREWEASGATQSVGYPGDILACNYALASAYRQENRSSEPYVHAFLSIGGPWAPGMESDPDEYRKVGGEAGALNVSPSQFGAVEKEILAAGAMTVTIRRVTMPPGTTIVTTDRYPTLRMVEKGYLEFASSKVGSDPTARPDVRLKSRFGWMGWGSPDLQIFVSNTDKKPAEFVEWSVAPSQGAAH